MIKPIIAILLPDSPGNRLKQYSLICLITCLTALFLLSCSRSENVQAGEREALLKQWDTGMREAFPDWARDPAEFERRLAWFDSSGNKLGQLMMYRFIGNEARSNSRFREALENHTKGLQIAEEISDTINITLAMNELATDFRRIGAFDEASPYYYRALEIAEAYRGTDTLLLDRNMASSYNGIGSICRAINEYDEAVRVYEKALELEKRHSNHRGMAINLANIGAICFERGEYDQAENFYQLSIEQNYKAELPMGIALCQINIGRIYEVKNKIDEALEQFLQAYEVLVNTTDKWQWLNACFQVAHIYTVRGEFLKAREYLDEGLETAQQINSLKHLEKAYMLLSEYHFALGNYKQAVEDIKRSWHYSETLQKNLELDRMLESRVKYETAKFSRQIEELDEQNRLSAAKRKTTLLLLIPVVVILTALVLMLAYKRKLDHRQAADLKKLEKMRTNFFTNMTHEFRTPVTVINGLAGHLLNGMGKEESVMEKNLNAIQRQGRQLVSLVNQLLDFSRSEAGLSKPKWRHGDLTAFLNMVAEPYIHYASSKGIRLISYSEEEIIEMNYAPLHIRKIIGNLLSNSLRHCSTGDSVIMHVALEPAGNRCTIKVKDTGSGISEENLPHIFKLYYTFDNDLTNHTGSGIGLALTKKLVEETEGTISVSSTSGKGTCFTISLPVSDTPIPETDLEKFDQNDIETCPDEVIPEEESEIQDEIIGKLSQGKKSILIVEDNKDVAHYISAVLSEKYILHHASDGNQGMLIAEQNIPDLIITDVMMPGKDGYTFTAELRRSLAISHIPVIMITARSSTEDKLEGLKSGADAWLIKPFDERELLARINQLMESRTLLARRYSVALMKGDKQNIGHEDQNMRFIAKLSVTVNNHLDDPSYFPSGLSGEMCLSESQLNRKLKAMTGHTITSFVMRARLNKAKQMLSRRNKTITEVAYDCGFNDLCYFSRSFKKVFGYTPSQFIKIPEGQSQEE